MTEFETKLQEATKRRSHITGKIERLRGRLEEAEANLETVKSEIVEKKIQPENLDDAILKLEKRFDKELGKLESAMEKAESALEPYESTNGER